MLNANAVALRPPSSHRRYAALQTFTRFSVGCATPLTRLRFTHGYPSFAANAAMSTATRPVQPAKRELAHLIGLAARCQQPGTTRPVRTAKRAGGHPFYAARKASGGQILVLCGSPSEPGWLMAMCRSQASGGRILVLGGPQSGLGRIESCAYR